MKTKNSISIFSFLLLIAFSFSRCGDKLNLAPWEYPVVKDENGGGEGSHKQDVETSVLEGQLLSAMPLLLNYQIHKYQYQRANSIDVYSGYFTVSNSDFQYGGALPYTYYYPNSYMTGPLGEATRLFPLLYHAYYYADNEKHNLPEWKAIAKIMYAYSMHELADFFGAIPFNDYRAQKETYPLTFQSTEECYDIILTELEEAVKMLKERQPTADALKRIEGDGDVLGYSKREWKNWVKFANSIRLRMALNMVKVDPGRAQAIAEAAVNDEIGVLQYDDDDFGLPDDGKSQHPLYGITVIWNDSRLGASLENILKRYENPLLDKWFSVNSAAIKDKTTGVQMLPAKTEIVGIRQGVQMYPNSGNTTGYGAFSSFKQQYMPRTYLKVTEVLFLKAEGALRGWNMKGTAQDLYEQGIRKVFEENGLSSAYGAYIAKTKEDVLTDINYNDYYVPKYSIDGRVTVGVAWDQEDTQEIKLEKIITQKYIANFPMGAEAWTTFRRTGYPRLFPVPEDKKWSYDDSFDSELQIRRLPYNEITANDKANLPYIEQALGGTNAAGTRVWWDVSTEKRDPETNQIIPQNF